MYKSVKAFDFSYQGSSSNGQISLKPKVKSCWTEAISGLKFSDSFELWSFSIIIPSYLTSCLTGIPEITVSVQLLTGRSSHFEMFSLRPEAFEKELMTLIASPI